MTKRSRTELLAGGPRERPARQPADRLKQLDGVVDLPPNPNAKSWEIRPELTVGEVGDKALAALSGEPGVVSMDARELIARTAGAMAALGLVYSDQGSQYKDPARQNWLRGSVHNVLLRLASSAGGIQTLREAGERAADPDGLMPMHYNPDGSEALNVDGHTEHLDPQNDANLKVRALAFHADEPADLDDVGHGAETPHDRYMVAQRRLAATVVQLEKQVEDLWEIRDPSDDKFVDREGLDRSLLAAAPPRSARSVTTSCSPSRTRSRSASATSSTPNPTRRTTSTPSSARSKATRAPTTTPTRATTKTTRTSPPNGTQSSLGRGQGGVPGTRSGRPLPAQPPLG